MVKFQLIAIKIQLHGISLLYIFEYLNITICIFLTSIFQLIHKLIRLYLGNISI